MLVSVIVCLRSTYDEGTNMDVEDKITKIERVSVRVTVLVLLLLGLVAVLVEAIKFIAHQIGWM